MSSACHEMKYVLIHINVFETKFQSCLYSDSRKKVHCCRMCSDSSLSYQNMYCWLCDTGSSFRPPLHPFLMSKSFFRESFTAPYPSPSDHILVFSTNTFKSYDLFLRLQMSLRFLCNCKFLHIKTSYSTSFIYPCCIKDSKAIKSKNHQNSSRSFWTSIEHFTK